MPRSRDLQSGRGLLVDRRRRRLLDAGDGRFGRCDDCGEEFDELELQLEAERSLLGMASSSSVSIIDAASVARPTNNEGTPYPSQSCLVARFHPDFESIIEPGVRQLLAVIAIEFDFVTYTSCEGHHYAGTDQPSDERHEGIIPRSADEDRSRPQ